jgi:DNA-directed RNA polymerase specialized sigma subunit
VTEGTNNVNISEAPRQLLSEEEVSTLVHENLGWAESIARSVARAWNMDWQLDGLDGGAYEALLFCARRFDPTKGVPFRAYARKRIHEGASEEARKSKAWQRGVGADTPGEQEAREISYQLFDIYPELREGFIPVDDNENPAEQIRSTIRQLLASASLISAFREGSMDNPETLLEYRQMFEGLSDLEPVHQAILWQLYWCGQSMRALADEWDIDELTIVREHKQILAFVENRLSNPKSKLNRKLKVRPSLRTVSQQLKRQKSDPPFARFAVFVAISLLPCQHLISGALW